MTLRLSSSPLAFIGLLGTVCLGTTAQAGDFLLQWDNDKVVDTDRHYTNGMRIAYVPDQPTSGLKSLGTLFAEHGAFANPSAPRIGWILGQDMYTPEDVETTVPDPTDRPYAGWSYVGAFAQDETETGWTGAAQQDTLAVNIGVVGPPSRAGETQNSFHRLINVAESNGWDSQIGTEPGLLISRTVKFRSQPWRPFDQDSAQIDIVPHATAQLGNIKTAASVGGTVRVGNNPTNDFGPIYGTFALPHKKAERLSWSLFAGAEGRLVVRDIFLDGNTFKNSPNVRRNPLVMESRAGISFHIPMPQNWGISGLRIDVSHVLRTREFSTQDKSDRYGSFQMTLNF